MLNKKMIIIGGDGIISSGIKQYNYDFDIQYFSRNSIINKFDLGDINDFDFHKFDNNHIILFLSAISKPIICENHKDDSYKINVINTKNSINNFLKSGATVIFASTDMVYGNNPHKIFVESDIVNPSCNYSEWKSIIEQQFYINENFKILRFSQCINSFDSFSKYVEMSILNKSNISIFQKFNRNIFDSSLLQKLITKLRTNSHDFKVLNVGSDKNHDRAEFAHWINTIYPNTTLLKYKSNNIDLISKISISNRNLKKLISENSIEFNYNYWLNKINLQ